MTPSLAGVPKRSLAASMSNVKPLLEPLMFEGSRCGLTDQCCNGQSAEMGSDLRACFHTGPTDFAAADQSDA
jgi:hypothetical protein